MLLSCENYFCIYQKDGACILDHININIQGFCEGCVFPDVDFDKLEKIKEMYREFY